MSSKGKFHYHKKKTETFYVLEGTLVLDIMDSHLSQKFRRFILSPGDEPIRIFPGTRHRFTTFTKTGCKFLEVSTTHRDDDSFYEEIKTEGEK